MRNLWTFAFLCVTCTLLSCGKKKPEVFQAPPQYTAIWDFFEGSLTTRNVKEAKNGLWIADKDDFQSVMEKKFLPSYQAPKTGGSKAQVQENVKNSALFFHISGSSGHMLFLVPGMAVKGGKLKYRTISKTINQERIRIIYQSEKGEKENGDEINFVKNGQSQYLAKQGVIRLNRESRPLPELMKIYAEPFTKQTQLPEY